jgi:hypothetical protein
MTTRSETDWERVRREAKVDAPILLDTTSESYDPNDEDAVFAYWVDATIRQNGVVTG